MRKEYDFSKGVRGKHAGKKLVIVGATDDDGDADGARQMPPSFGDQLEEEFKLADEAARRRKPGGDGDALDGWTVETGIHVLPPDAAAKLAGRDLREEVLPCCQFKNCAACVGYAFEEHATIKCSHFCHEVIDEGGEA